MNAAKPKMLTRTDVALTARQMFGVTMLEAERMVDGIQEEILDETLADVVEENRRMKANLSRPGVLAKLVADLEGAGVDADLIDEIVATVVDTEDPNV